MAMWYLVLVAACALYVTGAQGYTIDPADADLTVPQMIAKNNYPVEVHHVTTSDGYILEMHRIPHGRDASNSGRERPQVLLMHGLVSSSADFIVSGPEHALGYILADAGYDVWLGNCRGNYYSRNNTSMNPSRASFWVFSFEDHGIGDVIAKIDYILRVTGKPSLHYLGHSQGATCFMAMLALRPEYNARIISAQMLAPVTYLNNLDAAAMETLASFSTLVGNMAILIGVSEIYPKGAALEVVNGELRCKSSYVLSSICNALLPFFKDQVGDDPFLNELMPTLFAHMPAGGSVKQVAHYGQVMSSGSFRRFSHTTPVQNLVAYGRLTPPDYNCTRITVAMCIYFSNADSLAVKGDVLATVAALTSTTPELFEYEDITHFGFAWSPRAKEQIYSRVIECMRRNE